MAEFEYPKEPKLNEKYFTDDYLKSIKERLSKEPIRLKQNSYDCYKSPITSYVEKIAEDADKRQEDYLMAQVCLAIGYNIDKDELIKALQYDRHQYEAGYADGRRAAYFNITRCKDCKYWTKGDDDWGESEAYYYCDLLNSTMDDSGDDFCSRAERREE